MCSTWSHVLYPHKYSSRQNGQTLLYVKVIKSLYGLLKNAILFYNNLVKNLEYRVPKTNTYDPCVLNEIINGQHITVTWSLYDLKVSHK